MVRRLAVCDDEKNMLSQISAYLDRIGRETGDRYEPFFFTSGEELLSHMDRETELVLLDISMGALTGLDCARELRRGGYEGEIIFITSMDNYALEAYGVHAFSFLTKPLIYDELKRELTACFAKKDRQRRAVLPVETDAGTEILPTEEILFAEVYQHETSFAMADGRRVVSPVQLAWVEEKLAGQGFFRCHRSYLVNMRRIERIAGTDLTVKGGSVIPLSKHRSKAFLAAYTRCMGVELR